MEVAYHLNISAREQDELTVQEWEEAVAATAAIRAEAEKTK